MSPTYTTTQPPKSQPTLPLPIPHPTPVFPAVLGLCSGWVVHFASSSFVQVRGICFQQFVFHVDRKLCFETLCDQAGRHLNQNLEAYRPLRLFRGVGEGQVIALGVQKYTTSIELWCFSMQTMKEHQCHNTSFC